MCWHPHSPLCSSKTEAHSGLGRATGQAEPIRRAKAYTSNLAIAQGKIHAWNMQHLGPACFNLFNAHDDAESAFPKYMELLLGVSTSRSGKVRFLIP